MSFEAGWLWFLKLKTGESAEPGALCEQLVEQIEPEQLADLPTDEILQSLQAKFASLRLNTEEREGEVESSEEDASFRVKWSRKHFIFSFFGDAWPLMDRVVELMTSFGVPCYDGGALKMYTVEAPPRFSDDTESKSMERDLIKLMVDAERQMRGKQGNE